MHTCKALKLTHNGEHINKKINEVLFTI